MWFKYGVISLGLMALVGCQSSPTQIKPKPEPKPDGQIAVKTPDGIQITPYEREEIKRESLQVVVPQQKVVKQKFEDGRQLPAFKQLMQQTQTAFQQAKWNEAEQAAMQAQRIAPQSAEPFMYLAMIANHKNQARNAESLARRGLSYAQSDAMKRQLWQIILKSAQMQKNNTTIQEAQAKIKSI